MTTLPEMCLDKEVHVELGSRPNKSK